MKIKTITYNWKDDKYGITKLGFNAQNLLKTLPEVVQTHSEQTNENTGEITYKKNETLGVFYSDMIPVLTKSIQEQQAIINKNKARIAELEAKLKELDEKVKLILETK